MVGKLAMGHLYLQLMQFFPVSVIPPLLHITDTACQQSTALLYNI
jgi:hypothetical protein